MPQANKINNLDKEINSEIIKSPLKSSNYKV